MEKRKARNVGRLWRLLEEIEEIFRFFRQILETKEMLKINIRHLCRRKIIVSNK